MLRLLCTLPLTALPVADAADYGRSTTEAQHSDLSRANMHRSLRPSFDRIRTPANSDDSFSIEAMQEARKQAAQTAASRVIASAGTIDGASLSLTTNGTRVFDVNGVEYHGKASQAPMLPASPRHSVLDLGFANGSQKLIWNNLGGAGPNNGAASVGTQYKHPPGIIIQGVSSYLGKTVSMRIDNTTEYRPASPAANDFVGFLYQIGIRPVFDEFGNEQPYDSPFARVIANLINLDIDFRAENSNVLSLFYGFHDDNTGEPIELEEVSIRQPVIVHTKPT